MGFSRQEYWRELTFPSPGDLYDPGIKLTSPESPALKADSLPLHHLVSPGANFDKHQLADTDALITLTSLLLESFSAFY